jgi:hypothetical protein
MADMNQFAPQGAKVPQGATQINVRPPGGPQLGAHFAVNGGAPVQSTVPQGGQPVGQQSQAQIGQPSMPKGAQPVRLAASPDPLQQAQGVVPPGAPMPAAPAPAPVPALGQQQPPVLQPQPQPQAQPQPQTDVFQVVVEGKGLDGRTYLAEFDAVFPPGTKILGVRY